MQEADSVKKYIDAALSAVEELRGAQETMRRVVIHDENYLVMGVVSFLRELLPERVEEFGGLTDGSRVIQGFVGLVWHTKNCNSDQLPSAFPKMKCFSKLLEDKILPNWNNSPNSRWAESIQSGIPVPYSETVEFAAGEAEDCAYELNLFSSRQRVAPLMDGNIMLQAAINAALEGKVVSFCSNASLDYARQPFMNVTSTEVSAPILKQRQIVKSGRPDDPGKPVWSNGKNGTRDEKKSWGGGTSTFEFDRGDNDSYGDDESNILYPQEEVMVGENPFGTSGRMFQQPKKRYMVAIETDMTRRELVRFVRILEQGQLRIVDILGEENFEEEFDEFLTQASKNLGIAEGKKLDKILKNLKNYFKNVWSRRDPW